MTRCRILEETIEQMLGAPKAADRCQQCGYEDIVIAISLNCSDPTPDHHLCPTCAQEYEEYWYGTLGHYRPQHL